MDDAGVGPGMLIGRFEVPVRSVEGDHNGFGSRSAGLRGAGWRRRHDAVRRLGRRDEDEAGVGGVGWLFEDRAMMRRGRGGGSMQVEESAQVVGERIRFEIRDESDQEK